ncbi:hypothetical protein B0O80DRAFT_423846 [Mortierella sp. GBAus27b]|nr:hypothetical protein B0O80DRAFT_423846 [Mortierella sp. GBAus27b]
MAIIARQALTQFQDQKHDKHIETVLGKHTDVLFLRDTSTSNSLDDRSHNEQGVVTRLAVGLGFLNTGSTHQPYRAGAVPHHPDHAPLKEADDGGVSSFMTPGTRPQRPSFEIVPTTNSPIPSLALITGILGVDTVVNKTRFSDDVRDLLWWQQTKIIGFKLRRKR